MSEAGLIIADASIYFMARLVELYREGKDPSVEVLEGVLEEIYNDPKAWENIKTLDTISSYEKQKKTQEEAITRRD